MSTYQVTYYPPGLASGSAGVPVTVQAKEFVYTADAVVFVDDTNAYILAVPLALDPVVLRTVA